MAIKLVSLGDIKKKNGIQLLRYGRPGAGKTRLIEPLVIDVEVKKINQPLFLNEKIKQLEKSKKGKK